MTAQAEDDKGTMLWWAGLFAVAAITGLLLQTVQMPGGWLLGPMLTAITAGLLRPQHGKMPAWALKTGQAVIGILVAGAFRLSALRLVAAHWLPVLLVVGATLGVSLLAGIVLARFTSLDSRTAAFGTLPGGASGMIAMSVSMGADTRMVSLMQYIRLVLSVGSAALLARFVLHPSGTAAPQAAEMFGAGPHPWPVYAWSVVIAVAGAWLGPRLRMPAGALLGPLILGIAAATLHLVRPAWPLGVPQTAYLIVGLYVGLLFDRESLRRARRLIPAFIANTLVLMAVCALTGKALAVLTHATYLTGYLATTPGGLDSITVVALGSGADVSLMLAVQMMRLLSILFLGPLLARRLSSSSGDQP
jgi:membrane AbrB-like protein